jgi:hypothetical protein
MGKNNNTGRRCAERTTGVVTTARGACEFVCGCVRSAQERNRVHIQRNHGQTGVGCNLWWILQWALECGLEYARALTITTNTKARVEWRGRLGPS